MLVTDHHLKYVRGFSLIELVVTIALIIILTAIGTPSFINFQKNSQLTSHSNVLLASINAARSEAMKRGMEAMVTPVDGSDWNSGWIIFVDSNHDHVKSNGDLVLFSEGAVPSYISISGNGTATSGSPYLLFDSSGYAKTKAGGFGASTLEIKRTDVGTSDGISQTRRLKIASTGRARICTPVSSSDTNCSASAGL